jgi:hypothetical protein
MTLDFLADGSRDCPLLRLYGFVPAEARQLRAAVAGLAAGTSERVEVHRLPFVEAADGCRLTLIVQGWDGAVVRRGGPAEFACGFTAGTWDNVAALIEPFEQEANGFQWLAGVPGEAQLLLSVSGQW